LAQCSEVALSMKWQRDRPGRTHGETPHGNDNRRSRPRRDNFGAAPTTPRTRWP
jgi:hypothetical protein